MAKTLLVNLGEKGGCVYYANSLLRNVKIDSDIWLNPLSECSNGIEHIKIPIVKLRLRYLILLSPFLLIYYFIYLSISILKGKYDKVLVFGPHFMDFMILLPFRVLGKRSIYVVHDGIMHTGDAPKTYQIEIKWCLKIATELIFLSSYTKNMVKENLGISKKSFILPHGIVTYDNQNLEPIKKTAFLKYLLIGRITYYKGVDLIFDFLKQNKDFKGRITIAGKFSQDVIIPNELKSDSRLIIDDRWLEGDQIDRYMRECDILLMPYHEATQSGVAAMALGYCKPVIATDVGALKEQLANSAFYLRNDSVESLSEIINIIEENTDFQDKINAAKTLNQKYQWEKLSDSLVKFIVSE